MKLNGMIIPTPKAMNVEPVKYSTKVTMASGRRVEEVIAIKKRFTLNYRGLSPNTTAIFKDIYYSNADVPFEYEDAQGPQIAIVTMDTFPMKLLRENPRLSQEVTIILEEV
jgi:hypothetical protein